MTTKLNEITTYLHKNPDNKLMLSFLARNGSATDYRRAEMLESNPNKGRELGSGD